MVGFKFLCYKDGYGHFVLVYYGNFKAKSI
jgi:hypothetical protein